MAKGKQKQIEDAEVVEETQDPTTQLLLFFANAVEIARQRGAWTFEESSNIKIALEQVKSVVDSKTKED
jgi:hypothetical protein